MSLLLLISILVISNVYLQSNKNQNSHANKFLYASRLQFIENDIASDIISLLGTDININRTEDRSTISIDNLMLNDQSNTLAPYVSFIEDNFSKIINSRINITDLSELNINNIKLEVEDKTITADNLSNIYAIEIFLATSLGGLNNSEHPTNQATGTFIDVIIEDYYSEIVMNESLRLELGNDNSVFSANYGSDYINLTLANNTMEVVSSVDTRFGIKITFIDDRAIKLTIGDSSVASLVGIKKKGPILLARG